MLNVYTEVKISKGSSRPQDDSGINEIRLRPVEFEVNSSFEDIGKTAKIKFYLRPFVFQEGKLSFNENDTKFEVYIGDKIEIICKYVGYESSYDNVVFKGYVSDFLSLGTKTQLLTIQIFCEDEFWLFKNNVLNTNNNSIMINESFNDLTLKEVIEKATDKVKQTHGITIDSVVWDLNDIISFNIKKEITPGELLELIKERYKGIKIFFREDLNGLVKLYVGWAYWFGTNEEISDYAKTFNYSYIWSESYLPLIKFDLKFSTVNKTQVLVKITSTDKKTNTKLEAKYPDIDEGSAKEIKVINFNDGSFTQEELNKAAKTNWDTYSSGPLTGVFETFGFPKIRHGDKVNATVFINNEERLDEFVVDSVRTTLGKDGFRNIIKLISY